MEPHKLSKAEGGDVHIVTDYYSNGGLGDVKAIFAKEAWILVHHFATRVDFVHIAAWRPAKQVKGLNFLMFNDLDAMLTRNELVGNSGAPRNGAAENKARYDEMCPLWWSMCRVLHCADCGK